MEFLDTVTLGQVFNFITGGIAVLSVLVEFSKNIPFHPWTFILSHLGKIMNKDMESRLIELENQQSTITEAVNTLKQDMNDKFDKHSAEADTKEAKRLRSRIIDFADSCRVHQKHTKTAFENILRDYSDYVEYCKVHDIPNHFIDAEYRYISDVYEECQRENKFI